MNITGLDITRRRHRKRVARGISAGGGKTAGRGTKGQNSRSGGQRNPGFEGGQNPLFKRLPKYKGFKSKRPWVLELKMSRLNKLKAGVVTNETLIKAGLGSPGLRVKLLFDEPAGKAYTVKLQAASQTAKDSLSKAGGSFAATDLLGPKPPAAEKVRPRGAKKASA